MKLKIYEFDFTGAKDWVIAENKPNAIKTHQSESGMDDSEYDDVIIKRILKKDWNNYTYFEEDPNDTITFNEFMNEHAYCEGFFCSTGW